MKLQETNEISCDTGYDPSYMYDLVYLIAA